MRTYQNTQTGTYGPPAPGLVGAYALLFPVTGHAYYGSALDLRLRFNAHRNHLVKGEHPNQKLQGLFDLAHPMVYGYVPTKSLDEARAITRQHIDALRGSSLLCNERVDPLQSRESRAKAKQTFQTEAYKVKAGQARKAIWADPEYRGRLLQKRSSPEAQARRAAHFRRVSIDGVIYPGLTAASRALGLSRMTLDRRCRNLGHPTYFYLPPLNASDT